MRSPERRRWQFPLMALAVLFMQQIVFLVVAIVLRPTQEALGVLFACWMVLPALSAAALASNGPLRGIAAIVVTFVSVAVWSCLIVTNLLLPEAEMPIGRFWLASIHAAFFLLASVICAGFVDGILHRLDARRTAGRRALVIAGLRKGASFGALCAGITAVMMFFLGPSSTSGRLPEIIAAQKVRRQQWVILSRAVFVVGTLCGAATGGVTGSQYRPDEPPT